MLSVEKCKKEYQSFCFSCLDLTVQDASLCSLRDELHKRYIIFNTWWDDCWILHIGHQVFLLWCDGSGCRVCDLLLISPSFLSQLYIYLLQVSLINFVASLVGAGGIQAFKTMRTLRALRPLRAMSRMQGMRVCTQQSQETLEEHDDIAYKSAIGHHVRIDPWNFLLIVALFYYFGLEVNVWISELFCMRQRFHRIKLFYFVSVLPCARDVISLILQFWL